MKRFSLIFFILLHLFKNSNSTITQQCLECICYASSECDLTKKCHNAGPQAYYCGPYQITWAYWADGGKPDNFGHAHDFEKCLSRKECAERAVEGYMKKWSKDCNGDGVIDCSDFAAIHKFGPNQCSSSTLYESSYWKKFQKTSCYTGKASAAIYESAPRSQPQGNQPFEVLNNPVSGVVHQPGNYKPKPYSERGNRNNNFNVGNGLNFRTGRSETAFINYPARRVASSVSWTVYPQRGTTVIRQPVGIRAPTVTAISSSHDAPPKPISSSSAFTSSSFSSSFISYPSAPSAPASRPTVIIAEAAPARPSNPTNILSINIQEPVSDSCLACICQASSKCDLKKQCDGNVCGPYLLSWGYWSDAGKIGGDYVSCALSKKCSEKTIQSYMNKWSSDCNNDGVIDCEDYAAIHKLGPYSCNNQNVFKTEYWRNFQACSSTSLDARRPLNSERPIVIDTIEVVNPAVITELQPNPIRPIIISNNRPPVSRPVSSVRRPNPYPQPAVAPVEPRPIFRPVEELRPVVRPAAPIRPTIRPTPVPVRPPRPSPSVRPYEETRPAVRPYEETRPAVRPYEETRPAVRPYDEPKPISTTYEQPASIPYEEPKPLPAASQPPLPPSQPIIPNTPTQPNEIVEDPNEDPRPPSSSNFASFHPVTDEDENYRTGRSRPFKPDNSFYETNPLRRESDSFYPTSTTNISSPRNFYNNDPYNSPTQPPSSVYFEPISDDTYSTEEPKSADIASECLSCICEASSQCNEYIKCRTVNTFGKSVEVCGPYQISYSYWSKAGYPGYNGSSNDFELCANNRTCAEQAVRKYLSKNNLDCNKDGITDCVDYATIHKLGPSECRAASVPPPSEYWNTFQTCLGFAR